MHHGELLAGIDERLGTPEMNTVFTLTQEEHDDKERREPEKQQDEQPETKRKGKREMRTRNVTTMYVYYLGMEWGLCKRGIMLVMY